MNTVKSLCLDGGWRLYSVRDSLCSRALLSAFDESGLRARGLSPIPARVPGNFELDFARAGLLPDLFYGENITLARGLESMHLWYCRDFVWDGETDGAVLSFGGIDTFADVYLNGEKLGENTNMLIPLELPAPGLKQGENSVLVHIRPAVLEARKLPLEAGSSVALPYNYDSLPVRKAAFMYGWDIMPRIVSGGIWRSVSVGTRPSEEISELYFYTDRLSKKHANIPFHYRLKLKEDDLSAYSLRLCAVCGGRKIEREFALWSSQGRLSLGIDDPKIWWPRDMGEQNLYEMELTLLYRGFPAAVRKERMGIRTVRLDRSSVTDEEGSGEFCFYVNGERFFARGTNWVPTDPFPSRMAGRLPRALELLYEANCNMVRCWGGNIYESDEFYRFCDEKGIAVWQDFGMGCAIYPQNDGFANALAAEAEAVVKALRSHPSLFLWAGDNECDLAYNWSGIRRDPNKNRLTREVLPAVLERHDPFRPYLPSSPYIDQFAFERGLEGRIPEDHLWGPRDYYKSDFYVNSTAHFVSETGYHGCPSPKSIEKFISPERLWPWTDNPEWLLHATSMEPREDSAYGYRIGLMANQIKVLFGEIPDNLSDFAFASQLSQSEAKKFFIERLRAGKWRRTGVLWWNLLDGWPQFSDAVVDYYFTKKLAFDTIRRSMEPLCLMVAENGPERELFAANEYLEAKKFSLEVFDAATGELFAGGDAEAAKNACQSLGVLKNLGDGFRLLLIRWESGGKTGQNHYISGSAPFDYKILRQSLEKAGLLSPEGF